MGMEMKAQYQRPKADQQLRLIVWIRHA